MAYDMNVDYEALCAAEEKLKKVEEGLKTSVEDMVNGVERGQPSLAGKQYEKMKDCTKQFAKMTQSSIESIHSTQKYINELKEIVEEYSRCVYGPVSRFSTK